MVNTREFFYPSHTGVHQCFAQEWLPEDGAPRAVLQLVHGVAEYIQRYDDFARFMAGHGFVVCGEDHLGHGKTAAGGTYGYFHDSNGWTHVAEDVHALRVLEGEKYPGIPYFILGHSMGSFLTRTYLIRWPGTVTGAILSGTGQEPALSVAAGKLIARLVCRTKGPTAHSALVQKLSLDAYNKQFSPNRTRADWISRDEAVVDAYCADPLCSFSPTAGMFGDMMEGLQFISNKENLSKMDPHTPVYFFSGGKDPVGASGKGVQKVAGFFRDAGCRDITVKLYPDGRHEMLNEVNRSQVYADTLAWLESRLSAV